MPIDFQPNKLIRGAGPICLLVLDCLATQALKVVKVCRVSLNALLECDMFTFIGMYINGMKGLRSYTEIVAICIKTCR